MIQLKDKKHCCGCYACASRCPEQCITMEEDHEGFLYPRINIKKCNDCGLCELVCPVINRILKAKTTSKIFACKNKDDKIRMYSSSGGIFTLLAESVLRQNGVVFGARFEPDFSVVHDFTETKEGLAVFRGSKYLQSRIGDNYIKAEQFLKQGRRVLFSGTPCQIAGLKQFLRNNFENLLAMDFVCHGVPSPKVFRLYIKELNRQQQGTAEKIQFRNKAEGWKKYSFEIRRKVGKNSVSYRETLDDNIYLRGFLSNLYLRPSCHACPSKNFTSGSDLTIGDYWGIQEVNQKFDDGLGCSLVLCNSPVGEQIFEEVMKKTISLETAIDKASFCNPCITESVAPHQNREKFFEKIGTQPITQLILQLLQQPEPYHKRSIKQKIYYFLRQAKIVLLQ